MPEIISLESPPEIICNKFFVKGGQFPLGGTMKFSSLNESTQTITDEDIVQAMKKIPGYLDITPSDFMEVYLVAFQHAMSRLKNTIKANHIMTRKVITINEDASLLEVIKKMAPTP